MTGFADLPLSRRPAWPLCKVEGCPNEAALGGACGELHGGAAPTRTPGGYVLFMHWPEPGEDPFDPERWEPLAPDEWQCWCVSCAVWDRWAVDGAWPPTPEAAPGRAYCRPALPRFATRGGLGAPQPLRARAARALLREGRVSRIALQDQLEASNQFFPGLSPDPELLRTALGLLRLAQPLPLSDAEGCMSELAPFAAPEPDPLPWLGRRTPPGWVQNADGRWRPPGWGRSLAHKPPTERSFRLPLDAYSQQPEWPLPDALIDHDTEIRLIQSLDGEALRR